MEVQDGERNYNKHQPVNEPRSFSQGTWSSREWRELTTEAAETMLTIFKEQGAWERKWHTREGKPVLLLIKRGKDVANY